MTEKPASGANNSLVFLKVEVLFADAEKKVLPPNIQLYIARGIEPCNSTASGEARAVSLNFNKTRKNYGISWYGGRRPFILEEAGEKAG